MSENSRYFYMRLKEDFFRSPEMVALEAEPNGYCYEVIYLKMLLLSLRDEVGKLVLKNGKPFTPEMIAKLIGHDVEDVKTTINLLKEHGLIEILPDGIIYMMFIQILVGKSSTEADRQKAYQNKVNAEREKEEQKRKC